MKTHFLKTYILRRYLLKLTFDQMHFWKHTSKWLYRILGGFTSAKMEYWLNMSYCKNMKLFYCSIGSVITTTTISFGLYSIASVFAINDFTKAISFCIDLCRILCSNFNDISIFFFRFTNFINKNALQLVIFHTIHFDYIYTTVCTSSKTFFKQHWTFTIRIFYMSYMPWFHSDFFDVPRC